MDLASAEITKYAANAMLATRISFMNEMALLCDLVGANIDSVRRGVGSDSRIGGSFLFPGPGYGGSCFPKDVKALLQTANTHGLTMHVVSGAERANDRQRVTLFERLKNALHGVAERRIAVWGLTFKAQTDDVRESPALALVDSLVAAGAIVVVHDPVAMPHVEAMYGDRIKFSQTSYGAAADADALVIATDWNEYRHPDFTRLRAALREDAVVVDGRNLYDPVQMRRLGFRYTSIGRPDK